MSYGVRQKCQNFCTKNGQIMLMHLSISCPTPPPPGRVGDLTNRGVKFPTTGAKSAVKSPLCPHPHSKGFDNTSRMTKRIFHSIINKPALYIASKNYSKCDFIV